MKNNQTIKESFDFAFENHKKNNLKIAEKIYKKILEEDPNHFPSNVLLGTLSAQTKNFDLAKQLLEKAEDDLARARLNVAHAEQEVELAKDALAFALQSAQSALNRQRFVVSELERKITNLAVTASVSGVVGNLLVAPKSVVSVNQPLMTLVDLSAYEAEVNVAESYANSIGIGMDVELTIGARKVIGTLSAISPEVTEREVTTRVRFSQDALSQIRQNQQISARILLENKDDVVKVRRGGFLDAGGFVAYKLDGDVARRIDIETGVTSMREVEILSGLQPGEQIIVSGYQKFQQAPSVLLR